MANTRPSRCDRRQGTETGEAAPSLRRTASRCSAPASPSGGIFRRRIGNTAAAAHGCRPVRKRPLVERLPEAASLRARSNPGSRYRQDLPAGRSLPDRCSGSGHHRRSQSTAIPIASAFPQPAIDPTDRTSRVVIPPFSGHSPRDPELPLVAAASLPPGDLAREMTRLIGASCRFSRWMDGRSAGRVGSGDSAGYGMNANLVFTWRSRTGIIGVVG